MVISIFFAKEKSDEKVEISPAEIEEINQFVNGLQEKKSKKRYAKSRTYTPEVIVLEAFDPNTADSVSLRRLGIPGYVTSNIIKYRKAGGKFKDADAFSKIYGLEASLFEQLKPYINISPQFIVKRDTLYKSKRDSLKLFKFTELTLVDLNSADTVLLKKIPGIGSGLAKMTIAYRTKLGGFYSVEQLEEIEYIDKSLHKWFVVTTPIAEDKKIKVNSASLDRLRNHPYMNFYKARVIIEYRRKRGKIKNLSQLALFEEFTEKDLNKLSNYLFFD